MLLEIAQLQQQIDFVNDFHALALPGGRQSQLPPPPRTGQQQQLLDQ